jgi:hypothetical protein
MVAKRAADFEISGKNSAKNASSPTAAGTNRPEIPRSDLNRHPINFPTT